ncbi:MAG: T9SS type A sorting domain-containing protein [Ignavibacteriaceae bacterium]
MKKVFIILIIVSGIPVTLWSQNLGTPIMTPFSSINQWSVSGDTIFVGTYSSGLFYSLDKGAIWINITFPFQKVGIAYKSPQGALYVAADLNGLYRLDTQTQSWVYLGLPHLHIAHMLENASGYLMLFTYGYDQNYVNDVDAGGIYLTKDDGTTWEHILSPFYHQADGFVFPIYNLLPYPDGSVIVQADNGIFQSPTGEVWAYLNMTEGTPADMTITSDGTMYQYLSGNSTYSHEYYISTDTGKTWTDVPFTQTTLPIQYMFHDAQNALYIEATDGSQSLLYKRTAGSTQWTLLGDMNGTNGSTNAYQTKISSTGDIYYLSNTTLFRINSSLTAVKERNTGNVPDGFSLSQNYPNPFNPTTSINYSIPKASFVSIKVYDVLGNEVALLVNEEKPAGNYGVTFDAGKLSSGVYFYKMQAGNFVETKKLIVMK